MFHLNDSLGQFQIVEYSEDDVEEILPPRWFVEMTIRFHDFKHDRQTSEEEGREENCLTKKNKNELYIGIM